MNAPDLDRACHRPTEVAPLPRAFRLIGYALRHGPLRFSNLVLARMAASISARHPTLLQQLEAYHGKTVTIFVRDLGVGLNLRLGEPLGLTWATSRRRGDAIVAGNWLALAALLEGRVDGDALFFSRDLSIEGETELVVAVRNLVDGAGIDVLAEIAASLGPAAPLFARLAPAMLGMALRGGAMLDSLHAAALAPALARCEALRGDLDSLKLRMAEPAMGPADRLHRRRRPPAND